MEIVNGYPCRDCGEASLAARNIDPANPREQIKSDDKDAAESFAVERTSRLDQDAVKVELSQAAQDAANNAQAFAPVQESAASNTQDFRPGAQLNITV